MPARGGLPTFLFSITTSELAPLAAVVERVWIGLRTALGDCCFTGLSEKVGD